MTTGTTEPAGRLARLSPAGGGARWAVRLNAPARRVLLTVLAEIEVLAELDECFERAGNQYVVAMCRVGVPYRPAAWFGGPLASAERQAYSRATRRLERTGLLRRVTEPRRNRVTHVRLTYAGIAVAVGFARRDADLTAIMEGLWRTSWGAPLADALKRSIRRTNADAARQGQTQ